MNGFLVHNSGSWTRISQVFRISASVIDHVYLLSRIMQTEIFPRSMQQPANFWSRITETGKSSIDHLAGPGRAMPLQPPHHSSELKVAFPAKHVLLLTLNRPRYLNATTPQMTNDLETVLNWFEEEPGLWYVVNPISSAFVF